MRDARAVAIVAGLLAAGSAGAQAPPPLMAPLMAPLPAGPGPASPAAAPLPPGQLMAPLPAGPPARVAPPAAGAPLMAPLMAPLPGTPPAGTGRAAAPPARPATPSFTGSRDLPDGAVQVSPVWFAAEMERDAAAAVRRYQGRAIQVEAVVDQRLNPSDRLRRLRLRSGVGNGPKHAVSCLLLDDILVTLLAEGLRLDRPVTVVGIMRSRDSWSALWRELTLDDCVVLDGHPDPGPLRAGVVAEAALQWKRDENERRRQ